MAHGLVVSMVLWTWLAWSLPDCSNITRSCRPPRCDPTCLISARHGWFWSDVSDLGRHHLWSNQEPGRSPVATSPVDLGCIRRSTEAISLRIATTIWFWQGSLHQIGSSIALSQAIGSFSDAVRWLSTCSSVTYGLFCFIYWKYDFLPLSLISCTCYLSNPLFHWTIIQLSSFLSIHFVFYSTYIIPLSICILHMSLRPSYFWSDSCSYVFPTSVYKYCCTLCWYFSKSLVIYSSKS